MSESVTRWVHLAIAAALLAAPAEADALTPEQWYEDIEALIAAVHAPQATHEGEYLLDLFDMAATYLVSLAVRHPFIDGNKRTAAATALTFLYINQINKPSQEAYPNPAMSSLRP